MPLPTLLQLVVLQLQVVICTVIYVLQLLTCSGCSCCCARGRARFATPRSILITGATGGLGEALALAYARRRGGEVSLALTGRNLDALTRTATACTALGAHVRTLQADVLERARLAEWVREVDAAAPIDAVIANAGVTERSAGIAAEDIEGGARVCMATNVEGVFNTVFPALPGMRARGHGQVCVISSLASLTQFAAFDGYSASKAAVRMWGEGLRWRIAHEGIGVSVVCPGYLAGAMTDAFDGKLALTGMMSQEAAATAIIAGLACDEPLIAFPTSTFLVSWAVSLMPHALKDTLARLRIAPEVTYHHAAPAGAGLRE